MQFPLLYEINTRCWLAELSVRYGFSTTLQNIPDEELDALATLGFTHVWMMGVWSSGPKARAHALALADESREWRAILPDWSVADVEGSPYAIAEYRVPPVLGGERGLQSFRSALHKRGLRLILDFVPNHVGLDHPWVLKKPDLFIQGRENSPGVFAQITSAGDRWLAHGKDPNFPPWTDTVQLDFRRQDVQTAMSGVLTGLAEKCDGVRCDMAMLLLNQIFGTTWGALPPRGALAAGEFWDSAIRAVKDKHRHFLFLAEAYWGLEPQLQALGFDYTYDKTVYDLVVARDPSGLRKYLLNVSPSVFNKSAHFLENHDEPRVASQLSFAEHQAAALLILCLPGMRLLHEGQLSGASIKLPVQLRRRPAEEANAEITDMYHRLLSMLRCTSVGRGKWHIVPPAEEASEALISILWEDVNALCAVVINLTPAERVGALLLHSLSKVGSSWSVKDLLTGQEGVHQDSELRRKGLPVHLSGHGGRVLQFRPR